MKTIRLRTSTRRICANFAALLAACVALQQAVGQSAFNHEGYQSPSADARAVLEAEPTPDVHVSPGGQWLLLTRRPALQPIDRVAALDFGLLGTDPITKVPSGDYYGAGMAMTLVRVADGKRWELPVPSSHVVAPSWSPDGKRFIFRHADARGLWLMVGDVDSRSIRRVTEFRLADERYGITPCSWLTDSKGVICKTVLDDEGPVPTRAADLRRPRIVETSTQPSVVPTFTGRLEDEYDERLYTHIRTSQLRLLDFATMAIRTIGKPGLYDYFSVSPNRRYVFTAQTVPPYSRTSSLLEFPKRFSVLAVEDGTVHPLAARGEVRWSSASKYGGAAMGPRHFTWHPDAPATLVYVEAKPTPGAEVDQGDRLMRWEAPFAVAPTELFQTKGRMFNADDYLRRYTPIQRFANLVWLRDGKLWVEELDHQARRKRGWLVDTNNSSMPAARLLDQDLSVVLPNPGSVLPVEGMGTSTNFWTPWLGFFESKAAMRGDALFLVGHDANQQGRSFVDTLDTMSGARKRLFLSASTRRETPIAILEGEKLLLLAQSADQPPNYEIVDLPKGRRRAVTSVQPALASLSRISEQEVLYSREDGVHLRGRLILPENHKQGTRIPVLMWGYPENHTSNTPDGGAFTAEENASDAYGYSWAAMFSPPLLAKLAALRGYAVFLMPMPIIGNPYPNDTAVEQMVSNAKAAVAKLDAMGIADPARVAISGHSYGGEMTTILLTNSNLFAAGISINGMVNPLQIPGGFQDEPRTLWQAPDTYLKLTPLFRANKLSAPLLLIHGEVDNNPGSPLIDTERFFNALNTLGRPSRLVVLPGEGHSPMARESILHAAWEIDRWLDLYLKGITPEKMGGN